MQPPQRIAVAYRENLPRGQMEMECAEAFLKPAGYFDAPNVLAHRMMAAGFTDQERGVRLELADDLRTGLEIRQAALLPSE